MPLRGAAVELHTAAMCNKYGVAFNWHWSWYKGVFQKELGGENFKNGYKKIYRYNTRGDYGGFGVWYVCAG